MIARPDPQADKLDVWSKLSAPLPQGVIEWRQDGKPVQRDGKFVARFVCYIEANTVRERLDSVVPGEWDLTLELLPTHGGDANDDGEVVVSFKARLQILGVHREDVGTGRDYKSAATDAFKRAGVRFGIAHELYSFDQNWVQVDGDGRYAKPLQDPGQVYAARQARKGNGGGAQAPAKPSSGERPQQNAARSAPQPAPAAPVPELPPLQHEDVSCPKCGGKVWDNRLSKRNPKAPDFKCRNRACDGVVWPADQRNGKGGPAAIGAELPGEYDESQAQDDTTDEVPF